MFAQIIGSNSESKFRVLVLAIIIVAFFAFGASAPHAFAATSVYIDSTYDDPTCTATLHTFGVDCFTTIQAGISAVADSGTVDVAEGTYTENLTIDKSLTLTGSGSGDNPASDTILNGAIVAGGTTVVIQDLKIITPGAINYDNYYYGVRATADNTLTLNNVTIDVSGTDIDYYGIRMGFEENSTSAVININNSRIKGYAAIYLNGSTEGGPIVQTGTQINVTDSTLTGTTQFSSASSDFAVIAIDNTSGVNIDFSGTSFVESEYTNSAQAKERLIRFRNVSDSSVTGALTYTNGPGSTVNDGARFISYGSGVNTVNGQVVARWITNASEFEAALLSVAETPIVVARYEAPIVTTGDNTLRTGVTLLIEDNAQVTIDVGDTFTNNGTIIIEPGVPLINNGTLQSASITGTATLGQLLTATITGLTGVGTPSYQWKRDGVGIVGATASTYTLVSDDVGTVITVTATMTGITGTGFITSAGTATVNEPDVTPPAAFNVGAVTTNGGTIVASKWNQTNTVVYVSIPFANDASLTGGTVQVQADAGGGFVNVGSAYPIFGTYLGTTHQTPLTDAEFEAIPGFSDGDVVHFNVIITDLAGNPTTGTESVTTLTVDFVTPVLATINVESFPVSGVTSIAVGAGQTFIALGVDQLGLGANITFTRGDYTSSDPSIATVDPGTGLVTGVALGTVTITVPTSPTSSIVGTVTLTVTVPPDTIPNAFSFTDQTDVALSTMIESNTITVAGINASADVWAGGAEYSINGGAYTSTSGVVIVGDTVKVRHTSSASNSTAVNTILTIGGVSDTFTSTTLALPAPYLKLMVAVTNDDGGTAVTTDWAPMAYSTIFNTLNWGGVTAGSAESGGAFEPGTYELSEFEVGPAGYTASAWSCVKNSAPAVDGSSVTLDMGDSATCTITHNDVNVAPTVISVDSDTQKYKSTTPSPHTITVTFSEDISNTPTIAVSGGVQTVTNCGDSDAKTFCFAYTIPVATEYVIKTIEISGAQDVALNPMLANNSHTFIVDTIIPLITVSSLISGTTLPTVNIANAASYTLNGTYTELGSMGYFYWRVGRVLPLPNVSIGADQSLETAVTGTNVAWSHTWTNFFNTNFTGEGTFKVSSEVYDSAGNYGHIYYEGLYDLVAPTTPVINTVATDDIINAAERTATITVTGTNESGSTVTLNGFAVTVVSPTTWSYVLDAAAIDAFLQGAETLTAISTDTAGNPSANGTRGITVDTVVPTVTTVDSDGETYNTTTVSPHTITVTFNEDISNTPTISVSGGAQTVNNCGDADAKTFCFNYSVPPTQDTEKTVQILNAQDASANTMVNNFTHTFLVDTIVPVITLTGVNPQEIQRGSGYSELGATADDGSTVVINSSAFADTAGTYTITYNATDVAGNPALEVTRTVDVFKGNTSGSRAKRATPATPAVPGVTPAFPAIPSANAMTGAGLFTFVRDLGLGDQGADVTELQKRLTREGVYTGPITGYFGPLTFAGVQAYQRKMGIIDTGFVGPLTRGALNHGGTLDTLRLELLNLLKQLLAQLQAQLNAQ